MRVVLDPPFADVERFTYRCEAYGYYNNNTLKGMKYKWCLDRGGAWWAVYNNEDAIISMAGAHPFWDGVRLLFRGVQTEPAQLGLSKTHMTSIPWKIIMPEQIGYWSGVITNETPAYITTNVENDASGKMNRTHRVLKLLSKQGIVDYMIDEELFGVQQSVWRLNVQKYFETLD